jgi:hypothetical protein
MWEADLGENRPFLEKGPNADANPATVQTPELTLMMSAAFRPLLMASFLLCDACFSGLVIFRVY